MISYEEFEKMEEGTVFYVLAASNARNLVKERFLCLLDTRSGAHLMTYSGGFSFAKSLRDGEACYWTLEEAREAMLERVAIHRVRLKAKLAEDLLKTQERIRELDKPLTEEDEYLFLERSECEKPDISWWSES